MSADTASATPGVIAGAPTPGQTYDEWLDERVGLMLYLVDGDIDEMQHAARAADGTGTGTSVTSLSAPPMPDRETLELAYIGAHHALHGWPGNHHTSRLWKQGTDALSATRRFIFAVNEKQRAELRELPAGHVAVKVLTALIGIRDKAMDDIARVTAARASDERWKRPRGSKGRG